MWLWVFPLGCGGSPTAAPASSTTTDSTRITNSVVAPAATSVVPADVAAGMPPAYGDPRLRDGVWWYGRVPGRATPPVPRPRFDLSAWLAEHHVERWTDPVCVPYGTTVPHPTRSEHWGWGCDCDQAIRVADTDLLVCSTSNRLGAKPGSWQTAAFYRVVGHELRWLPPELPISSEWTNDDEAIDFRAVTLDVASEDEVVLLRERPTLQDTWCGRLPNVERVILADVEAHGQRGPSHLRPTQWELAMRANVLAILSASRRVCDAAGRYEVRDTLVRVPESVSKPAGTVPSPSEDLAGWLVANRVVRWEGAPCIPPGISVAHDLPRDNVGVLDMRVSASDPCPCTSVQLDSVELLSCWQSGRRALYRVVGRRLVPVIPQLRTAADADAPLGTNAKVWLTVSYRLTVEDDELVYTVREPTGSAFLPDAYDCESIAGLVSSAADVVFPVGAEDRRTWFLKEVAEVAEVCNSRGRYRYVDGRLERTSGPLPP